VYKDLHAHPELSFHETRTAALVATKLKELGYDGGLLYDPLGSHAHLTRGYIRDMVTQTSRAVPMIRV
jgi:hippurate hydrolase